MTRTLAARSRDLRERARATDVMQHRERSAQLANTVLERREAMRMLEEFETQLETSQKEFIALEARVFELCTIATRGPSGHSWLTDLPQRENGSAFYQALRSLARYLAERKLAALPPPR